MNNTNNTNNTTSYEPKITDAPKKPPAPNVEYKGTPKKLQFDESTHYGPIPGKLIQPFQPIEWVYPNDEESQFYSYEQMQKDWVPSDLEEVSSSDDEYEEEPEYEEEWW